MVTSTGIAISLGANLGSVNLEGANFGGANFGGANLRGANLDSPARYKRNDSHPASAWASAKPDGLDGAEGGARASAPRQFAHRRLDLCVACDRRLLQRRAEWNRDVERGHAPR